MGVIGNLVTVTPMSESASSMAEPTNETPAIVPDSPTPFIPPGMCGDGVSWWMTLNGGISMAVGIR